MMKKISFLFCLFTIFIMGCSNNATIDRTVNITFSSDNVFLPGDKVVIDASTTEISNPSSSLDIVWNVINENEESISFTQLEDELQIEIANVVGKYQVSLTIENSGTEDTETTTIYVAESEYVDVALRVTVPSTTPTYDSVFLGHAVTGYVDWLPYATEMQKITGEDYKWIATMSLKAGSEFRCQPTRGSWGTKARKENGYSDFHIVTIPYKDATVDATVPNWGIVDRDPSIVRQGLLLFSDDDGVDLTLSWQDGAALNDIYLGMAGYSPETITVSETPVGKEALFADLTPDTEYYYSFTESGGKHYFHTAGLDNKFRFAAYGDAQNTTSMVKQCAAMIGDMTPDLLVSVGDMSNEGLQSNQWNSYFFQSVVPYIQGIPFAAAPGNHESGSPLFNEYLSQPMSWNTFVYENVRFIFLDVESTYTPGSLQYQFLEDTLALNDTTWKVIVCHESPVSNAPRHYSNYFVREHLAPLFHANGVDFVITGHNHVYTRSKPISGIDGDGEPVVDISGIIYITLPAMGSSTPDKPADFTAEPFTELQVYGKQGFAVCDVDGNTLDVEIIASDNSIIDSFTLSK